MVQGVELMAALRETLYSVPKMDCPSEERLIRVALEGLASVHGIACDLSERQVRVLHTGAPTQISEHMTALGLGAEPVETVERPVGSYEKAAPVREARTLRIVLAVNALMFVGEFSIGWIAESAGLLADSLDMFADAAVYGFALYVVERGESAKITAARVAGWLEGALAIGALIEVVRRFFVASEPAPHLIMVTATVALAANAFCLWLVSRHRHAGAHMKASTIFSANDVLANLGVLVAGGLVAATGSRYPDLVIGGVIALVVLWSARRILRLAGPAGRGDERDRP